MSTPAPETPNPTPAPASETPGATPDAPDEKLGAPGLAALKAEREARAAAEKERTDALAKVKEYEDRDKSEQQKAQERLDAAEKRAAEFELKATRAEVAAAKGVPVDLLSGSTQAELEASADALIAFRGEPGKPRIIAPGEGKDPKATTSPSAQFADFITQQLQ